MEGSRYFMAQGLLFKRLERGSRYVGFKHRAGYPVN